VFEAAASSPRAAVGRATRRRTSRGAFLVEALIASVIFSMAAAGLFALLANALRASNDALLRTEASGAAASTLARMSADDFATLADRYDSIGRGPGFLSLVAMAKRLPGVTDSVNTPVVVLAPGPSANSLNASVTVYWQLPNETSPRRASITSVVAAR